MGRAISEVLPFAVGVAISPVPIIAVILVLFSARARVNGVVFLGGFLAGGFTPPGRVGAVAARRSASSGG